MKKGARLEGLLNRFPNSEFSEVTRNPVQWMSPSGYKLGSVAELGHGIMTRAILPNRPARLLPKTGTP